MSKLVAKVRKKEDFKGNLKPKVMRKLYFLLLLLGGFFFSACEKDALDGDQANPADAFNAAAIARGWVQSAFSPAGKSTVYVPAVYANGTGYQFSASGTVQSVAYENTNVSNNVGSGCGSHPTTNASNENASVNSVPSTVQVLEEGKWSLDQVDNSWVLTLAFANKTSKYRVPELNNARLKMELMSVTNLNR
jgi:hypothetical protein